MNAQFYQSASYVPPDGTKAEQRKRQEQWDDYQRQQRVGRASMSDIPDSNYQTSTQLRKRADSHQPSLSSPQLRRSNMASHSEQSHTSAMSAQQRSSHDYDERPRRYSSTDPGYVGHRLSPQLSPSYLYDEPRLSGTFNSPTHVELERSIEHRKSLKGVERLRSKVKGWARA
ncbi:hypothetical protein IQ06DRAFT_145763 [Phaeosphaeriaceae sp. SRC1lsM3a]|nr:hypothetical protein IQ06DRAFT_145763 [Stagonospora sp. SRC1lsM3a]